jgi:hypothetical protein
MKAIKSDTNLIAYCGLYCGACRKFLNEKCPGCRENTVAAWCKVRSCCIGNKLDNCAACITFEQVMECKKFNNFFSKLFALVFKSDRAACIRLIREHGPETFAGYMAENKLQSIKR